MSISNHEHFNTIYNGDCVELLRSMPDSCVDLVITDPPYILDIDSRSTEEIIKNDTKHLMTSKGSEHIKKGLFAADSDLSKFVDGFDVDVVLGELERVLKKTNMFIFCSNKQITELMLWGESRGYYTTLLVWHKHNATPFASSTWRPDLEYIVHIREPGVTFNGDSKLKKKCTTLPARPSQFGHPTEKPIALIEKYIKIGSNPGDLVFDPFMGSGTTAVAAKRLGRNFMGSELEPKFYKVCLDRLQKVVRSFG